MKYYWYRFLWWLTEHTNYCPPHPLHVDIELTNECNLACTFCPHGDSEWKPVKGMMSTEMAKSIIDQCAANGVFSIKFNFRGEPAMHPDLVEIVKYAKDRGILEVQFNTNGIPFTRSKVRGLVEAGLDRFIVSVDGATQETYSKIRVKGDVSKVDRTLKWMDEEKRRQKKKKPHVRVQMTVTDENRHEQHLVQKNWEMLVDEINFKPVRTGKGKRKSCPQPRQRLVYGWSGLPYGCCNAWNDESLLYPVSGLKIDYLWEDAMPRLRKKAKHPDKGEPCKSCEIWSSYKSEKAGGRT